MSMNVSLHSQYTLCVSSGWPLPALRSKVQHSILQVSIFEWIPVVVCNNWIMAVREGFSSDYTDYSLHCSDGLCGLKSIIWLVSHRKSSLANMQMLCLPTFHKCRPKVADVSSQVDMDQSQRSKKGWHLIRIIFAASYLWKHPWSSWFTWHVSNTHQNH